MTSWNFAPFFDLASSSHRALFKEEEPIWSILRQLAVYIRTLPLGKVEGEVEVGAYLKHPELIFIGEGSVVEAGAYLVGPCYIGRNCQIRHGAYLRGNVIAEDHSVIGHATEVKNALFLEGAHAGHFAYVGDSILGKGANLGAGVKCANLRLDGKEVVLSLCGQRVPTGLRKLGAIVGDGVQIGCNSVLNPGTLIGKGAAIFPSLNVGGWIEGGEYVRESLLQTR